MHTYIWTRVDIYTVLTHIYIYLYRKWCTFEIQSIFPHIQNRIFFLFCSCCTSDHTVTKHDVYVMGRQRCWMKHLFPPRLRSNQRALASFQHDSIDTDSHRQNIYINICGTVCYTGGEKTQGTFNQVFGQNHHGFYWVQLVWIWDWKKKKI